MSSDWTAGLVCCDWTGLGMATTLHNSALSTLFCLCLGQEQMINIVIYTFLEENKNTISCGVAIGRIWTFPGGPVVFLGCEGQSDNSYRLQVLSNTIRWPHQPLISLETQGNQKALMKCRSNNLGFSSLGFSKI